MKTEPLVTLKRMDRIALLSLNRPARHNALVPDLLAALLQANNFSHDADTCLALGLAQQVVDDNCDAAALSWAQSVAKKQAGSVCRSRKLLNTDIEGLRRRLEAERENFVSQIQTQAALDGIDLFLRRHEHV